MHFTRFAILALPAIAMATNPNQTPQTDVVVAPAPTSADIAKTSPRPAADDQAIIAPLDEIINNNSNNNNNEKEEEEVDGDLKIRQAPGQLAGGSVPKSPDPTQMSPVTTYMVYIAGGAQSPVVYTQTFAAVPEQWDAPKSGTIGLGSSITGQIGIVKTTSSKRNYVAQATDAIKHKKRSLEDVVRRGLTLEKRKKKSGSGGNGNAAGVVGVPSVLVTGLAALGVFAFALLL